MGTYHTLTSDALYSINWWWSVVFANDNWFWKWKNTAVFFSFENVTFDTHLRWSKISWCSSWEVRPWMAHTAWRLTSVCLKIIFWYWDNILILFWYWDIILQLSWWSRFSLTIIGDELIDPFSTSCRNLPAKNWLEII